jgi:hypothetical protein
MAPNVLSFSLVSSRTLAPEIVGGVRWTALQCVQFRCNSTSASFHTKSLRTGISGCAWAALHVRFDFGVPSFVHFFGRAKKWTTISPVHSQSIVSLTQ